MNVDHSSRTSGWVAANLVRGAGHARDARANVVEETRDAAAHMLVAVGGGRRLVVLLERDVGLARSRVRTA